MCVTETSISKCLLTSELLKLTSNTFSKNNPAREEELSFLNRLINASIESKIITKGCFPGTVSITAQ